ncbi:MAG: phosphoglycerate kinase [Candidatus Adiutrix sp.]
MPFSNPSNIIAPRGLNGLLNQLPFLNEIDPEGQRVFVRADFNVPIDENGAMTDDGRLRAVLPSLNYLLDRGAAVIVGSHLRNPLASSSTPDKRFSLAPLAKRLSRIWGVDVLFSPDIVGEDATRLAQNLKPGQVLLLENLRFNKGEAANDPEFAAALAKLADIYVNDAFGVCHRSHASMTSITQFMKTCVGGFALKNELMALNRALSHPARPMAAIIGGNSLENKLPVVANFMGLADYVLLGGSLGDAFSRIMAGGDHTQNFVLTNDLKQQIENIIQSRPQHKAKLFVPVDAVALAEGEGQIARNVPAQNLTMGLTAKDIGPATRLLYRGLLSSCYTIIWSGPMGVFEIPAFSRGTALVTRAMSECQGVTLAGGVDTSAAIMKMSDRNQISFISAGGSAFLRALAGQPLAALESIMLACAKNPASLK